MSNIKIHFAGADNLGHIVCIKAANVNYALTTAFNYIERNGDRKILDIFSNEFNHSIMDSGLFTMIFGSGKNKYDKKDVFKYFDKLIKFYNDNCKKMSCVEVDCQQILSPKIAWDLRKEMHNQLPNHDIINVFHLEDHLSGLEELCDFSNYIALGGIELKKTFKDKSDHIIDYLVDFIRKRRPDLRIHLLGCASKKHVYHNKNKAYSSDATTWNQIGLYNVRRSLFLNGILKNEKTIENYQLKLKKTCEYLLNKYELDPKKTENIHQHYYYHKMTAGAANKKLEYSLFYGNQD